MSYFISSMAPGSLSEMPPVSKVMPLPTSTTVARSSSGILDDDELRRLLAASVTARKHPFFRASVPLHRAPALEAPRHPLQLRARDRRCSSACQTFEGRLARSRCTRMAFATAVPCASPAPRCGGARSAHGPGEHGVERGGLGFLPVLKIIHLIERSARKLCGWPARVVVIELLRAGARDRQRPRL